MKTKDKLHAPSPDGLETSVVTVKPELLAILDASPDVKHVIHNACK
jgi:hypothetical protein